MMRSLTVTALVGVIAVLMAGIGLGLWFAINQTAPLLGLNPDTNLARSSIRADNGTLFLTLAAGSAYAAIRQNPVAARICAAMFLIAFSGRLLTAFMDGPATETIMPMLLEGGSALILLIASRAWRQRPASDQTLMP